MKFLNVPVFIIALSIGLFLSYVINPNTNTSFFTQDDLDRIVYNEISTLSIGSITKPIYINNSNILFRDQNKEIISISKIKKFEYFFDFQNKSKKLNIIGNLFGSNFKFNWIKNYSNPYITSSNLNFKNPSLNISNKFNKENENFVRAETNVSFLRNNLDLELIKKIHKFLLFCLINLKALKKFPKVFPLSLDQGQHKQHLFHYLELFQH